LAVAAVLLCPAAGVLSNHSAFPESKCRWPLVAGGTGIGTVLAIIALFLPQKSRALCAVGILFNVLPLFCALALLWYLSHSNFAWD
jgi:hypothetical protein